MNSTGHWLSGQMLLSITNAPHSWYSNDCVAENVNYSLKKGKKEERVVLFMSSLHDCYTFLIFQPNSVASNIRQRLMHLKVLFTHKNVLFSKTGHLSGHTCVKMMSFVCIEAPPPLVIAL